MSVVQESGYGPSERQEGVPAQRALTVYPEEMRNFGELGAQPAMDAFGVPGLERRRTSVWRPLLSLAHLRTPLDGGDACAFFLPPV